MGNNMDKWMQAAGRMVDRAAKVSAELVSRGRDEVDKCALLSRIAKMEKQLGALVYATKKNGTDSEEMVNWYVEEIDRLKLRLAAFDAPEQDNISLYKCQDCGEGVKKDAMFCSRCGTQLSKE